MIDDNEIKLQVGQNIFDIAIQNYGSIEAIFDIAKANQKSVSDYIQHGLTLKLPGQILSKPIVDFFNIREKPATGNQAKIANETLLEGIDYWAIELDFIVQ